MYSQKMCIIFSIPVIACLFALAGCGGDQSSSPPPVTTPAPTPPPPSPTPPASLEREIAPSAADTSLPTTDGANIVINPSPSVTAKGRLVIMLPGTGGIPRNVREVLRTGPPRGYHAIALTYPNAIAIGDLCAGTTDANCTGNARRETITGEDLSTLTSVNVNHSIVGRLTRLLTYLNTTYPTEGWGQYLRSGTVDWSLVTVGGHSQGSGHAAYMAKLYSLDRTVMFSGPSDVGVGGQPATWLSLPNITPASKQYGFTHIADGLVPYALVRLNWSLLGIDSFGAPTSVDTVASPYGSSHHLTTNLTPDPPPPGAGPLPSLTHLSTAIDAITPHNAQGQPVYAPVWIYLMFP